MRLVKSEEEIGVLAKAGALARKTVNTMIEYARPGITEAQLWAEMIRTQIANNGEPQIFNMLTSGPVEHPTKELWHLLHGSEQPISPSARPLQVGDLVVNEFHTQYGGYLAATEFTIYIGKKAPPQLLNIHKVCVEALQISQEVLVPGKTLRAGLGSHTDDPQKKPDWTSSSWVSTDTGLPRPSFPRWSFDRVSVPTA